MPSKEEFTIPGWFVKLVTATIAFGTPFVVWLTVSVMQLQYKVETLAAGAQVTVANKELITNLTAAIDRLGDKVTRTEVDVAALNHLRESSLKNEYRIEALERKTGTFTN